jgi:hypothetical protein
MQLFPTRTDDEQARITANYLPNGFAYVAKHLPAKTMYKFIKGVSKEFGRLEAKYSEVAAGWLLTKSAGLMETWEKTLLIPDGKIPGSGTTEERRLEALMKLAAEGIQTADDYEWWLSLGGISATVWPGHYFWTNPDPRVPAFSSEKESRFTLVIEADLPASDPDSLPNFFPVPFPWVFKSSIYSVAQKFIECVKPANVQLVWITTGAGPTGYGYFPYGLSAYGGTTT